MLKIESLKNSLDIKMNVKISKLELSLNFRSKEKRGLENKENKNSVKMG